jgi:putative ATPase
MTSGSLFDEPPTQTASPSAPLADRMRPTSFDELTGQDDLLGQGRPLRQAIERDTLQSIIFWGPPGTGKTTLARLIATVTTSRFVAFSAVLSGIKEIRTVMTAAEDGRRRGDRRTILFVDEIHRFNKAQQDAFLPRVEAGDIVLIGATTENPSFEVNAALLSRSQVYVLQALTAADITTILTRALTDKSRGLGTQNLLVEAETLAAIARHANGDARVALNLLELGAAAAVARAAEAGDTGKARLDLALASETMQRRALVYDKDGEEHFNLMSALHKSMRNSDPDAAVYWLARMAEAGEDPLYIARRLVRFASEDVGIADPQALTIAVAAKEAVHFIGMPEGNTALAQATLYLASAPKSNAVYTAYSQAATDAHTHVADPVPLHLRNAPTRLMRQLDYGKGYRYAHDEPDAVAAMDCLPPSLQGRQYYVPTTRGFEKDVGRRLEAWRRVKAGRRVSTSEPRQDTSAANETDATPAEDPSGRAED